MVTEPLHSAIIYYFQNVSSLRSVVLQGISENTENIAILPALECQKIG